MENIFLETRELLFFVYICNAKLYSQKIVEIKRIYDMKQIYQMFLLAAVLLLPLVGQSQDINYFCDFEDEGDSAGWVFVNGLKPSVLMLKIGAKR